MPRGKQKHGGRGKGGKQQERITRAALRRERKSGAYLSPGDPDFRSFANQLAVQGLALKDVPGDGNCLFRALADQLSNGHTNHRVLRRDVITYMRENRDEFAPFIEEDITFDEYLSELAQDGEYAGNDAIVAFSRCYFMHVVIHQLNAPRWEVHAPRSTAAAALNLKTLHIAYLNGEHYCSIQPLIRAAESASATPLLPQLSIGCGKGEEKAHTPGQRATHTSKKKKKSDPTSSSSRSSSTGSGSGPAHQLEHEVATCSGVAMGSTSNPPPIARSTTSPHSSCPSSSLSVAAAAAAETLARSTGCKDIALVEDCLRENNYKTELAIVELLQLMSLAEDTSSSALVMLPTARPAASGHHSRPHLPPNPHLLIQTSAASPISSHTTEALISSSPVGSGRPSGAVDTEKPSPDGQPSPNQAPSSDSPQKHVAAVAARSGKPPSAGQANSKRSQKPGKARNLHHQQHHLSNRERKELAKAERKQRRDQERKENRTKPSREGDGDSADPVGATAI